MKPELDGWRVDKIREAIARAENASVQAEITAMEVHPTRGTGELIAFRLGYIESVLEHLVASVRIYVLDELYEVTADAG